MYSSVKEALLNDLSCTKGFFQLKRKKEKFLLFESFSEEEKKGNVPYTSQCYHFRLPGYTKEETAQQPRQCSIHPKSQLRKSNMKASWSDLDAKMLEDQIFAADVDVSRDPAVAIRFDISSSNDFPAFVMLRRGNRYSKRAKGGIENIEQWVTYGWKQETSETVSSKENQFAIDVNRVVDRIMSKCKSISRI